MAFKLAKTVAVQDSFGLDPEFQQILGQLMATLQDIRAGYRDVSRREHAWRSFQQIVTTSLWQAVENLDTDPYRQQLADVLDAAVTRLQAFQLGDEVFSAIEHTLARLSATHVSEQDVDACENTWRAADVDTIPSLGEAFEQWLASCDPDPEDAG